MKKFYLLVAILLCLMSVGIANAEESKTIAETDWSDFLPKNELYAPRAGAIRIAVGQNFAQTETAVASHEQIPTETAITYNYRQANTYTSDNLTRAIQLGYDNMAGYRGRASTAPGALLLIKQKLRKYMTPAYSSNFIVDPGPYPYTASGFEYTINKHNIFRAKLLTNSYKSECPNLELSIFNKIRITNWLTYLIKLDNVNRDVPHIGWSNYLECKVGRYIILSGMNQTLHGSRTYGFGAQGRLGALTFATQYKSYHWSFKEPGEGRLENKIELTLPNSVNLILSRTSLRALLGDMSFSYDTLYHLGINWDL